MEFHCSFKDGLEMFLYNGEYRVFRRGNYIITSHASDTWMYCRDGSVAIRAVEHPVFITPYKFTDSVTFYDVTTIINRGNELVVKTDGSYTTISLSLISQIFNVILLVREDIESMLLASHHKYLELEAEYMGYDTVGDYLEWRLERLRA